MRQLDADLRADPGSCGFEGGLWNSRLMRLRIRKKFGVQYSKSGTLLLAHELDSSWRKSRPGTKKPPQNAGRAGSRPRRG